MTLRIDVCLQNETTGEFEYVVFREPWQESAGFDSWRHGVWGVSVARELGLVLLPSLAEGEPLYASDEDLVRLEQVAVTLLDHLDVLCARMTPEMSALPQDIALRANNIRVAARRAQALEGTLSIG